MDNETTAQDSSQEQARYSPVATNGLLYITRAYNMGEITIDEWIKQSREWADRIISEYGQEQEGGNE